MLKQMRSATANSFGTSELEDDGMATEPDITRREQVTVIAVPLLITLVAALGIFLS